MSLWDRWSTAMIRRAEMFAAPRVGMPLGALPATFRTWGHYKLFVLESKAPDGTRARHTAILWQWRQAA